MELCQIACEKFAAAEKTPYERDNQAAATMIKVICFTYFHFLYFLYVIDKFMAIYAQSRHWLIS